MVGTRPRNQKSRPLVSLWFAKAQNMYPPNRNTFRVNSLALSFGAFQHQKSGSVLPIPYPLKQKLTLGIGGVTQSFGTSCDSEAGEARDFLSVGTAAVSKGHPNVAVASVRKPTNRVPTPTHMLRGAQSQFLQRSNRQGQVGCSTDLVVQPISPPWSPECPFSASQTPVKRPQFPLTCSNTQVTVLIWATQFYTKNLGSSKRAIGPNPSNIPDPSNSPMLRVP